MDWFELALHRASLVPQEALSLVPERVPGRVLIVDGDMIAYSNAGNDDTPPGNARISAINRIENMRDMSGSEKIVLHLTSEASTKGDRYIIATVKPYQGNRSGGKRPKNWAYLREWMESYTGDLFTVKTWGTREADDGIAYHATVLGVDNAVIATADKDMRMIPAWHLDWSSYQMTRLDKEFGIVGENGKLYGHKWFFMQLLTGDSADGIPGLPKYVAKGKAKLIGEVTATKFLSNVHDDKAALGLVAALYHSFYEEEWPDRLAEQMSLLWMRRDKEGSSTDWVRWFITDPDDTVHQSLLAAAERLEQRITAAKEAVQ